MFILKNEILYSKINRYHKTSVKFKKMRLLQILSFFIFSFIRITEGKQILIIDRIDVTSLPENSSIKLNYIKTNFSKDYGTLISTEAFLGRNIAGGKLNMDITVTRCASRESLDNCENFKKLKPSNFCIFLNLKGVSWTEIIESFEPPFRCPFKKGKYSLKDGIFDIDSFRIFPLTGYYWKVQTKFFDADELLFETYIELRAIKSN